MVCRGAIAWHEPSSRVGGSWSGRQGTGPRVPPNVVDLLGMRLSTSPRLQLGGFAPARAVGNQHVVRTSNIELSDKGLIAGGLLPKLAQA